MQFLSRTPRSHDVLPNWLIVVFSTSCVPQAPRNEFQKTVWELLFLLFDQKTPIKLNLIASFLKKILVAVLIICFYPLMA